MDEILSLPLNNPVAPFETSSDITDYLQEQWSGLFQRLLRDEVRQKELSLLENLRDTAGMLNQLVTLLAEEKRAGDQAVRDILLTSHPIFGAIRSKIKIPYRVFFTNKKELKILLNTRYYKEIDPDQWDDETKESHEEWLNSRATPSHLLKIAIEVFDNDGRLKIFTPDEWQDEWVTIRRIEDDDDDVPF